MTILGGFLACPENTTFEMNSVEMAIIIAIWQFTLWRDHGVEWYVREGCRWLRKVACKVVLRKLQRMIGAVLEKILKRWEW